MPKGYVFGYSDLSTIDTRFPNQVISSYLWIPSTDSSGDIVYENTNGDAQWIKAAVPGFLYPTGAVKVLSSGMVNGNLRTTTATEVMYGGSGVN